MKALVLLDKDDQTKPYRDLIDLVRAHLKDRGFEIESLETGRGDLAFCTGCFGCWIKKPGECVIGDGMANINRTYMNSDVAVYVSPVVFGQLSTNIKTVVERWLPNILPFFEIRPNGSTMHPARYKNYPSNIFIGEGSDATAEDCELFTDIIQKHRRNANVVIHTGSDEDTLCALRAIKLEKAGKEL